MLARRSGQIRLEVHVGGRGFDPLATSESSGPGERAELLGGELKISSEPGKGTSVVKGEGSHPGRLLIVDYHDLAREGMQAMLAKEPGLEEVGEAENRREAVELCRELRPNLVLMDVRRPAMDGDAGTQGREHPKTSVLMVTTHENPDTLLDAVRAGAAGYVLKDATKRQLLDAMHWVLDGESPLNQELAMQALQRVAGEDDRRAETPPEPADERRRELSPEPLEELLSARELEVLRLLVRGKTNREAAEELHVSLSTVKNHVHHLITKLGVSDRTQAAVRAARLGLIPEEAE